MWYKTLQDHCMEPITRMPSTMPQTCLLLHSHGVRDSAKTAMCHSTSAFRGHWSRQMSGQLEEMTDFLWCFHVFVKHPWFWAITKPGKLRSKSHLNHLIILDFLYFMKIHKLQWYLRTKSPTTMAMDLGKQVSKTRSPRFRFHVVDVLMPMNRHRAESTCFCGSTKSWSDFCLGILGRWVCADGQSVRRFQGVLA